MAMACLGERYRRLGRETTGGQRPSQGGALEQPKPSQISPLARKSAHPRQGTEAKHRDVAVEADVVVVLASVIAREHREVPKQPEVAEQGVPECEATLKAAPVG